MKPTTAIALAALAMTVLSGCGNSVREPSYRRIFLGPVDYKSARDAAVMTMREFFKLKPSLDENSNVIEAKPQPVMATASMMRPSDYIAGRKPTYKRFAKMILRREKANMVALLRVEVMRPDSHSRRAFAYMQQAQDIRTRTPIEEETATTGPQETIWLAVRRESGLENRIAQRLKQRVEKIIQQRRKAAAKPTSESSSKD